MDGELLSARKKVTLAKGFNYAFCEGFTAYVLVPCKCINGLVLARCRMEPSRSPWLKCKGAAADASPCSPRPWAPCTAPRPHGRALPKTQTHLPLVHVRPTEVCISPGEGRVASTPWRRLRGTAVWGHHALMGTPGDKTCALGRLLSCEHGPPPSPPAPRAELAATSEPEPLLQEVSSDAGVSLADFKDPLEVSGHNTYF